MKKLVLIGFCFLVASSTYAQEELGIANSNYAGVNGLHLNPSSIVDSWVKLDIHLIGTSAFVENNYVYLPKEEFSFFQDIGLNSTSVPDLQVNNNSKLKYGTADVSVQGPSFMLAAKNNSFALSTRVRSYTNINGISPELARFLYEGFNYTPQHGINFLDQKFRVNTMTWGEVGFTYGRILFKNEKSLFTAAATAKRLIGIQALSMNVENVDYEVINETDLQINDITGQYGIGDIGFDSGKGWGGDIGVTYKRMKEDASDYVPHSQSHGCDHIDYKYKIGVSLIDMGAIRFTNAQYGDLDHSTSYWSAYDSTALDGINSIDSLILSRLSNVTTGTEFKSTLPMAISIQYDQNLGKNFFVNITAVHGLTGVKKIGLHRSSIIGVTPRYEIKRFEVAMPVSLYEYQRPRVGLAFRFNSVVIGSDNIFPFIGSSNVYGADIYMSLKYSIFKSGACSGKKGKKKKKDQKDFVAQDQAYPCPIE